MSDNWDNTCKGNLLGPETERGLKELIALFESKAPIYLPPPSRYIYDDQHRIIGMEIARGPRPR